jgi:hypothetical protein
MSTASEREAALRRALLHAAERIEPAPGGFERIQVRLRRPRPAIIAWLEAAWTALVMRAPDVTEAVRRRAESVARLVWERFGPKSAAGPGPHRLSWIRPLAAMSVAVFVLGGGIFVALQSVSSTISPTNGVAPGAPGGGSQTSSRAPGGHGTTDGHASRSPRSSASSSARPSPSCSHTPQVYKSKSASPGASIDSSPPTPTISPSTTTSSPSPTPSDSPSPTPSGGSSTPSSGGSASTPDTGAASENPASAGGSAVDANATETAALVSEATGASTSCHS